MIAAFALAFSQLDDISCIIHRAVLRTEPPAKHEISPVIILIVTRIIEIVERSSSRLDSGWKLPCKVGYFTRLDEVGGRGGGVPRRWFVFTRIHSRAERFRSAKGKKFATLYIALAEAVVVVVVVVVVGSRATARIENRGCRRIAGKRGGRSVRRERDASSIYIHGENTCGSAR